MDRFKRQLRREALERAAYHRYAASRGWLPGGRDPLTGLDWEKTYYVRGLLDPVRYRFAGAIHKAHARFWLGEARRLAA